MILKEKLINAITLPFSYEDKINESVIIAEEFAIGFVVWYDNLQDKDYQDEDLNYKDFLEIYKKGL